MTARDDLSNIRLLFSASVPKALVGTREAAVAQHLAHTLLGAVLERGGTVILGGHPTITQIMHHVANRLTVPADRIVLHQLQRFASQAPAVLTLSPPFAAIMYHPKLGSLDEELTAMREAMVAESNAAFFVGGQTFDQSLTTTPGLRDEWNLFRSTNVHAPAYVSSLLGGYAAESLVPDVKKGTIESHDKLDDRTRTALMTASAAEDVDLVAGLVLADLAKYVDSLSRP